MAITSELLGKLGGADVEVIPVSGTASGGSGSVEVLATIEIPPGETWAIAVIGEMDPGYTTTSAAPYLMLGSVGTYRYNTQNHMTVAGVHSETVEAAIKRSYHNRTDSFTGHAYIVKL